MKNYIKIIFCVYNIKNELPVFQLFADPYYDNGKK